MLNGYKCRLYPSPEPEQILLRWIGCQRVIYNAKVQEDRYYRRFQRQMVGMVGETVPVDQEYSRFITERTAFLKPVPAQILRNGAVKFRQAYPRFFNKLGGRPKIKRKSRKQSVRITAELFRVIPRREAAGGDLAGDHLHVGTDSFPVGILPYVAHRPHSVPSSIHIAVEDGQWWLSFAADDPQVTMSPKTAAAATEQIAEDLRHLSPDQLAQRTLGGDRGVAKPLATSDGQVFDLRPVQHDGRMATIRKFATISQILVVMKGRWVGHPIVDRWPLPS
ncbi:MAG: helix-turn-helix domain-containing protein [Thermaerobacter sp.]|nr:helix-turn-helix domain-containing protein [Thermaerobacter sp.]